MALIATRKRTRNPQREGESTELGTHSSRATERTYHWYFLLESPTDAVSLRHSPPEGTPTPSRHHPLRLAQMSPHSKYESRDEVEKRLINTTLDLLLTRAPDDLTVREIARLAQCHHPNISNYFGNKAGLFATAYPLAVESIGTDILPQSFISPSPEIVRLVRLTAWLEANFEEFFSDRVERPLFTALTAVYTKRFKINEGDAALLAQRLAALMMAAVLHPSAIALKSEQFPAHFALEVRLAQLLATHPPGTSLPT